jgi:hypothetical protein
VNPEYRDLTNQIVALRADGRVNEARQLKKVRATLPSNDPHDPNYRRLRYVRYADDFLLGFSGPKCEAEAIKARLAEFLRDRLKLELSQEKTLITHAKSQPAHFLGYDIAIQHCNTRRRVNGCVELRIPREVIDAKCARFKRRGKPIQRSDMLTEGDFDIVARFGMEYRGFVQYYKLANNIAWLTRLHWAMKQSLLKTLANKHRSTVCKMIRKYASTTMTPDGKKLRCLEVVVERPNKKPLVARFGGISLCRAKGSPDIRDEFPNAMRRSRTELEVSLLAERCELCGATERIAVHHIRKLADLKVKGRREKPLHVRMMAARRRKTLVVCASCHDAIHAGRPTRKASNTE